MKGEREEARRMPRIVGPCLLHSTIPIFFKNPGGFEFLGSMSFNQTELGRERETTPGGEFRRMGHVRRLDPAALSEEPRWI